MIARKEWNIVEHLLVESEKVSPSNAVWTERNVVGCEWWSYVVFNYLFYVLKKGVDIEWTRKISLFRKSKGYV
jgi:hypothetical protein